MRKFSEFEKEKIECLFELGKSGQLCVGDFLSKALLRDRIIEINHSKQLIGLITLSANDSANFLKELFGTLSVLEELKQERLTWIHKNPQPFRYNALFNNLIVADGVYKDSESGKQYSSEQVYRIDIPTDVWKIIADHIQSFIFVTPALEEFINNEFKSDGDLELEESRKQTKWSIAAFIVALLALIVSIFHK